MLRKFIFGALAIGVFVGQAVAQPVMPEGIALYAGGDITFKSSSVLGGDTVAGGNVLHTGGGLRVESIFGGGGFTVTGASSQDSTGEWYFNGDIINLGGPGRVIGGPVRSTAGNIDFKDSSQDVFGDVVAAGNIDWQFSIATIFGDVTAGGLATVTPDVTGTITSGATVNLPTFVPTALPADRGLVPSSNHINLDTFEDAVLAPGTYGDITFESGNTLSLTTGSYVFNSINSDFSLNRLDLDTTNGPIDIYIAQDVDLDLVQVINGVELFSTSSPDPEEALNVFIETGGDFDLGRNFYGTIFAPNGSVTAAFAASVTGGVFAGGDASFFGGGVLVPEPLVTGDMNGDGMLTNADISAFVLSLTDPDAFATAFPEIDPNQSGDFNDDDLLTNGDIAGFVDALTGGAASISASSVPEPASLSMLAIGGLLVVRRRSR